MRIDGSLLVLVVAGWILLWVTDNRYKRKRKREHITGTVPLWIRAFGALLYLACSVGTFTVILLFEGNDAKAVMRVLLLRETTPETLMVRLGLISIYLLSIAALIVPGARRRKSEKSEAED